MATAPDTVISKFWLIPEYVLLEASPAQGWVLCERVRTSESCTHCESKNCSGYDRRMIKMKDIPLVVGTRPIEIRFLKRRFFCKDCHRIFSERLPGVLPRRRTTERFRKLIRWACERFNSISQVSKEYGVSSDFVYRVHYEQLELKRRMNNQYCWPEKLGIDDNCVGHHPVTRSPIFVTMLVNHSREKLMEVAFGRTTKELCARLAHIPGRENVRIITLDMSDSYRSFAKAFFPKAQLVADKFHVIRLLSHVILKERRRMTGKNTQWKARRLLLCSSKNLDYFDRLEVKKYLYHFPRLRALYEFKEGIHNLYRIKGYSRAKVALDQLCFDALFSTEPEIQRLGRTLQNWSKEILNYFAHGLTNARVEGFNNKASLVRRQAYGYRNLNNLRLKLLSVCG